MRIIPRSEWGASPWVNDVNTVPLSERTEFYIHYDGATPITRTGSAIPQSIEAEHLGNGWSGIGYHFVVSQAGEVFEGRGWDLQGAHCPGHNRSAFGVQIAVGGDQAPSAAALSAAVDLYEAACSRTGRTLAKHGHRDGFATDCPGEQLYPWVLAGMPRPDNEEDPLANFSEDDLRRIVREEVANTVASVAVRDTLAKAQAWWEDKFLTGTVPPGADAGWAELVQKIHAGRAAALKEALADSTVNVHVDVTGPTS